MSDQRTQAELTEVLREAAHAARLAVHRYRAAREEPCAASEAHRQAVQAYWAALKALQSVCIPADCDLDGKDRVTWE